MLKFQFTIIGVQVGFEESEVEVYENAGRVQVCTRVLKPTSTSYLEYASYGVQLSTRSNSSMFCCKIH